MSPDRHDGGELTAREAEFLSARDGIYQATVSETGWPYVQFRGGAPEVIGLLHDGTGPKVERGIVIRVAAFDWNCPQHIPIRRTDAERDDEITQLRTRIKTLESRLNETAGVTQEAELPE